MAWRDIRVKYAQTFLGLLWALLNPLFTLFILSFVFGTVVKVDSLGIPHLLFTMAGLVAWNYFSILTTEGAGSLLNNQNMIRKIYFPKLAIPFSKALSGLPDFLINLVLLLVLFIIYGKTPSSNIIYLPLFILLIMTLAIAGGIWISALSVRFRDFKFITPFLIQLGLYASPIAYPMSSVPEKYLALYQLNPIVGLINGFRWCLFDTPMMSGALWYSVLFIILALVFGLLYFSRVQSLMSDII